MKPTWQSSDRGEAYTLALVPNLLVIEVVREIGTRSEPSLNPYYVKLFGTKLKGRWSTAQGAQAGAVRAAKKYLADATAVLEEME